MTSHLYYGDNLDVLRESIDDESVDLIYLDPPFNSNATYNILFKAPSGEASQAQIEAFEDTWHWNDAAEKAFDEVMQSGNGQAAEMLRALRSFLHDNDVMAYITHISLRMLELHRVLKPTGSLYLHCDPTASHYLKIMMDAVFGTRQYTNEIVWKRTSSHNTANRYGKVHDVILYYRKGSTCVWNKQFTPYSAEQLSRYKPDANGRLYKAENLTANEFRVTRGNSSGAEQRLAQPVVGVMKKRS